jgi:hypothetical protein
MDAHNIVGRPQVVTPAQISGRRSGNKIVLRLPPKSVTVVELR